MKKLRNIEEFPYSLHDSKIQKFEYIHNNLILYPDYIFSYNENRSENTHRGKIIFEKTEIEEVSFIVLNDTLCEEISLLEYQDRYKESKFEIIIETYNWGRAVFQGWLWTDDIPVYCIMNIFFLGKVIYEIEE